MGPRGYVSSVWTGSEVVVAGGFAADESALPCPPEAECEAPERDTFTDVAAFDPEKRTWRSLPAPGEGVRVPEALRATDSGLIGAGARYDAAAGRWVALPALSDVLLYDQPQWTGSELVAFGWDYTRGESNGVGQVVVAELDPDVDVSWRVQAWPMEPPGLESISSVWTGEEAIAFVWTGGCDSGPSCTRMMAWNPAADTWRAVTTLADPPPRSPSWSGGMIVVGGGDGSLQHIDALTGEARSLPDPPAGLLGYAPVVGSDAVAVVSDHQGSVLDLATMTWTNLPPLPAAAPAVGRAVVWAGDDLFVWGGQYDANLHGSRNSAEGFLLRVPGRSATEPAATETTGGTE